jgi:addiction module RelB/DinJ family antitoxin
MNEVVQARVDKATKQDAERIFSEIGLDMSSAIRIFLLRVQREGGFPFDINAPGSEKPKTAKRATGAKTTPIQTGMRSKMRSLLGHKTKR